MLKRFLECSPICLIRPLTRLVLLAIFSRLKVFSVQQLRPAVGLSGRSSFPMQKATDGPKRPVAKAHKPANLGSGSISGTQTQRNSRVPGTRPFQAAPSSDSRQNLNPGNS